MCKPMVGKIVETRLRWFVHVKRGTIDDVARRVDQIEER